jgi:hypothetical protein
MHLDGEIRPIEMRLHDAGGALELRRERRSFFGPDIRPGGKPEPARPGRRQLRH